MKSSFKPFIVGALLTAVAASTAYGESSKSHFFLRSNALQLNTGYSLEALGTRDFFGIGLGYTQAEGKPRFSKKNLVESLHVSQVHLRADFSLRSDFTLAGPLLSFDIKRSEGTTQLTSTDASGCQFVQNSKGVLFSNSALIGFSSPKKYGFQMSVFAGAQYITSTPSYSVKIESLNCDATQDSVLVKSGRWFPEAQVLFGIGI